MPVSVSTGVLAQLIGSLLQGEDNIIEKFVFEKIQDLGKEKISELIRDTPLGAGMEFSERFANAIEQGGAKEFKRARDQWLNTLKEDVEESAGYKKSGQGATRLAKKIQTAFQKAAEDEYQKSSKPKQGFWKWSRSRQEWLNEDWRHDWRSQPRSAIGRWIPGRLNTIYVSPRIKKARSARRRYARKQVKEMMRGR